MPLLPPVPRDELHLRRIELRGYRRADGLYDVEARMVDTKTHELTLEGGRKNILPDCETIRMEQINEAFERMERSDVRYRFVIDMALLKG